MEAFERFAAWVDQRLGISSGVLTRLVSSLLVILAYMAVQRLTQRIVARTFDDALSRYQISKATRYVFGAVALGVLIRIWVEGVTGAATYLGLLSAGVAIALQDPIINLAGWLYIVVRRPFRVGHRIQIGPHAGDVVDIGIFQFTILEIGNWVHADQSTGRVIHVPNGWAFKNSIANYEQGFHYIWNEIEVVVTFESNWRLAKQVLRRTVSDHSEHLTGDAQRQINESAERYHIKFAKLTPVVWTSVVDHGIRLTMRYLCKPRERRRSEDEIWEAVLGEFEALADVDLAYPTMRYFSNPREGRAHGIVPSSVKLPIEAQPPPQLGDAEAELDPELTDPPS
jgi:small-conductance mechanosensitive channel